ncbi:MAG: bifunctional enoyl-CoA hydratase/phosphate acetyltransferase [Peptococcaceae bacterium]|nr:bifunctional enoyl-CoA hydratase/phosphate acetyltransferase [Peptococcaceae bacterium]
MLKNYEELMEKSRQQGKITVSVAAAQDKDVLQAVKAAMDRDLIDVILVGDQAKIRDLLAEVGLPADTEIIDELDVTQAALRAVALVREGKAQVYMKGLVNSAIFLKALVDKEVGLRTGRILSHLTAYEIPGAQKLVFFSDGGVNIAPGLEEKKEILINALEALSALGYEQPKVAVLAANEVVNPKMPATVDAAALMEMNVNGAFAPAIVEGPIAMDVAVSAEAAHHKGIASRIAGEVDLFLMPGIEAGNILSKALVYYANFKIAGVIVGAANPAVMVSRSDTAESKLYSIVLACLIAGKTA